jgi:hypothetical protein
MSKKHSGCLRFILGSCHTKKNTRKTAVSIENNENKEPHTDIKAINQDLNLRNSAPGNLFKTGYKPVIVIRDSQGFHVQNRKSEVMNEQAMSELNSDPLISSRLVDSFSNKTSSRDQSLPNPFVLCSNTQRPKLIPITPDMFSKRKLIASKPCKNSILSVSSLQDS